MCVCVVLFLPAVPELLSYYELKGTNLLPACVCVFVRRRFPSCSPSSSSSRPTLLLLVSLFCFDAGGSRTALLLRAQGDQVQDELPAAGAARGRHLKGQAHHEDDQHHIHMCAPCVVIIVRLVIARLCIARLCIARLVIVRQERRFR